MKFKSIFALVLVLAISASSLVFAQEPSPQEKDKTRKRSVVSKVGDDEQQEKKDEKSQNETKEANPSSTPAAAEVEAQETKGGPSDIPAETQANRREEQSEEQATIAPYYNNFFTTYRLGPEDVISVTVFGQDRYSKNGITIPPNGRISYPLIPEGVFVNGRTVEQVQEEITKKLDEYIIDPKVSVSLDKATSYRYSVLGDVAQPGIKPMPRRLSVTEALAEAGGILPTGNKAKVVILRRQANGQLSSIPINVSAIYKGRLQDDKYLVPGDQVIVPGNKLKGFQSLMGLLPILSFARIFTGGF
ncbi:MAG: polysaccharide biosynthesis/export family protein [Pyrinomonadaceae bacterium]